MGWCNGASAFLLACGNVSAGGDFSTPLRSAQNDNVNGRDYSLRQSVGAELIFNIVRE